MLLLSKESEHCPSNPADGENATAEFYRFFPLVIINYPQRSKCRLVGVSGNLANIALFIGQVLYHALSRFDK